MKYHTLGPSAIDSALAGPDETLASELWETPQGGLTGKLCPENTFQSRVLLP